MKKSNLQSRDTSMDIVRIVAVFTVLSVHFFLHNGFYSQPVQGNEMYLMVLMRTFFSICVPLFMILTGYLMSKKTLSKKYYLGITKTISIFVLATVACMIFKSFHDHTPFTLQSFIFGTLDFTGANYSWYIEMYIGLFLLIPFINLMYNKLANKKQKTVLVATMVILVILPTFFNIFNFDPSWWVTPTSNDTFAKLIPSWWTGIYPIAYYFVGCYLREYGLKIKTSTAVFLLIASIVIFGSFNFYRSYGGGFKSGTYVYWGGFEPFIMAVLVFVIISRFKKANQLPNPVRLALLKVSDLAIGIYLLSYIFDMIVYEKFNSAVLVMTDRVWYYILIVPLIFVCSMILAALVNFVSKSIFKLYHKFMDFIKSQSYLDSKLKIQDCIFIAVMFALAIFAFWKCQFGFGGNDEAFYLTIPNRLTLGDALIQDEWHVSQLSGFLLYPFVALYKMFTGGTDGIILTARYMYVIFHLAVSVLVYIRLRKHGFATIFAAALFFIYTPYDIMALSYNTMGLDLVVVTGVLMATADYTKKLPLIFAGLAFAGSVLCNPYLLLAYAMFIICVIINLFIKKTKFNKNVFASELFSLKTFLWFTVGAAILAVVFGAFLLSRTSVNDIMINLPYMLSDPEHPSIPMTTKIGSYFNSIINCQQGFYIVLSVYVVILALMAMDKNRKNHRALYLVLTAVTVLFAYTFFLTNLTSTYYNAIMFPLIFLGITSYILCDKKPRKLLGSLFALGIVYSFAMCCSSNQYFYVISMAISASNIASIVFTGILLGEMNERKDDVEYWSMAKKTAYAFAVIVLLIQGVLQLSVKAEHCFWETDKPENLTSVMQGGPASGIATNINTCSEYQTILADLQTYKTVPKGNILYLTEKTWCYLATPEMPYGTFSAWLSGENTTSAQRLEQFYNLNPEKIPEYVYIPKVASWDFTNIYNDASSKGYSIAENNTSYKLTKIN